MTNTNLTYTIKKQFKPENLLDILKNVSQLPKLSANSKGIFLVLVTIDQVKVSINQLISLTGDQKLAILVKGLKELVLEGIIFKKHQHGENGKFNGMELVITCPQAISNKNHARLKTINSKDNEFSNVKPVITYSQPLTEEFKEKTPPLFSPFLSPLNPLSSPPIIPPKKEIKPLKAPLKQVNQEEFKKIYDSYQTGKKTRVYPYNRLNAKVTRAIESLGSIGELLSQINHYLDYISHPAVAEWRQRKSFEAWINNAAYYGHDWISEKIETIKQARQVADHRKPKTKAEIWAEKQRQLMAQENIGGSDE
jgi:hypothetical protein